MVGYSRTEKPVIEHIRELCVQDIMTQQVISVCGDAAINQIASVMCEKNIHRILVVENQHLIGIIESLDLVKLLADCEAT